MQMKLKECQGMRVRVYQHQGQYLEGDKVWYQHQGSNAWLCPAKLVYHKANKVWLHTNGDIKEEIAALEIPSAFILVASFCVPDCSWTLHLAILIICLLSFIADPRYV